jgi:hypothetical protein
MMGPHDPRCSPPDRLAAVDPGAVMRCPQCRHENPGDAKFCLECGRRLALMCASCATELPAGAKFCKECGASVSTSTPAASPTPAPDSYTPKHLAERIINSKAALEGERKQVTVLFADLKGSMELLADRDPEDARKLLDPVIERMMEAVHRYEGTVTARSSILRLTPDPRLMPRTSSATSRPIPTGSMARPARPTTARRWRSPSRAACGPSSPTATSASVGSPGTRASARRLRSTSPSRRRCSARWTCASGWSRRRRSCGEHDLPACGEEERQDRKTLLGKARPLTLRMPRRPRLAHAARHQAADEAGAL